MSSSNENEKKSEFPFNLNDLQINDLFGMLNRPSKQGQEHDLHQQQQQQQARLHAEKISYPAESLFLSETMDPSSHHSMMTTIMDESSHLKHIVPRPEMLEQHNTDIERYLSFPTSKIFLKNYILNISFEF